MSKNVTLSVPDSLHEIICLNKENLPLSKIFRDAVLVAVDQLEEKRKRLVKCRFCENEIDSRETNIQGDNVCDDCYRVMEIVRYATK